MAQPRSVVEAPDTLLELFRQSQAQLEAEQAAILTDPNADRRRARLRQLLGNIETELVTLEAAAGRFVADTFPAIYRQGGVDIGVGGFRFDQFNRQALELLQDDTMSKVLAATGNMAEDSKRWVRETARALAVRGEIEGQTAAQMARQFARLAPKAVNALGLPTPITAVTYADGSVRTLATYSDMLMRTQTSIVYNHGAINTATTFGVTRFEIRDGPNCFAADTEFQGIGGTAGMIRTWSDNARLFRLTTPLTTLTVGPNHPILTATGWKPAHLISEGDHLFHSTPSDTLGAGVDDDLHQMPATAEQVFASLDGPITRDARAGDLHGDAFLGNGKVEVVFADRELAEPVVTVSEGYQVVDDDDLVGADEVDHVRSGSGGLFPFGERRFATGHSFVGWAQKSIALLVSRLIPLAVRRARDGAEALSLAFRRVLDATPFAERVRSVVGALVGAESALRVRLRRERFMAGLALGEWAFFHLALVGAGLRAVPAGGCRACGPLERRGAGRAGDLDSVALVESLACVGAEGSVVPLARDAALLAERFGFPGRCHPVLSVEEVDYSGWVYDAESVSGLLLLDGIIAKNCGLSSHDDGTVANGMIVDAATALAYPISHPNCRRSISGRPDLDGTPVPPVPERAGPPIQIPVPTRAAAQRQARAGRQARQARTPRSG